MQVPDGGLRLQVQFSRREDMLRQLENVLELQLNALSGLVANPQQSSGMSKEDFDRLPVVRFAAARMEDDELANLSISELKRLMAAHQLSDLGCIEKVHLVDSLSDHFASERDEDKQDVCTPCVAQPLQCSICIGDFRDGERLRQLPCAATHVFHDGCIQQWMDKHTNCPLCRHECGEPQPEPEPEPGPIGLAPEGLLASMATQGILAQLARNEREFALVRLSAPIGGEDERVFVDMPGLLPSLSHSGPPRPHLLARGSRSRSPSASPSPAATPSGRSVLSSLRTPLSSSFGRAHGDRIAANQQRAAALAAPATPTNATAPTMRTTPSRNPRTFFSMHRCSSRATVQPSAPASPTTPPLPPIPNASRRAGSVSAATASLSSSLGGSVPSGMSSTQNRGARGSSRSRSQRDCVML